MPQTFDYNAAFDRNIGWITALEQLQLRGRRVAIAGMGGVGGAHLVSLARLGIGAFTIADLDRFELANFNRQAGAFTDTTGRPKVRVMAEAARKINPEADIRLFEDGVKAENLDDFLADCDLFVDGLDFFVLGIRAKVFARCRQLGIPAITAAPVGLGTSYIVFMPDSMSFEKFFRLGGLSPTRQYVNFALGLTPSGLQRRCLVDPARLDLIGQAAPSNIAACNLASGVMVAEAAKILLGRGRIRPSPWVHQFDAWRGGLSSRYLAGGNRHPLQIVKRHIGYRTVEKLAAGAWPREETVPQDDMARIIAEARWAPSGDNRQPWRFEISGESTIILHLAPHDAADPYDYNGGEPSLISAGCLLESLAIAASRQGRRLDWKAEDGSDGYRLALSLPRDPTVAPDPLYAALPVRSVDRRRYRQRPLGDDARAALEAAIGPGLTLDWYDSGPARRRIIAISQRATDIRLRLQSAYEVHRQILDWRHRFSQQGIPVATLGLDALSLKLMHLLMKSWPAMDIANRFFGATLLARAQMDVIPGWFCAAHFVVRARDTGDSDGDALSRHLAIGRAVQRLWLTATAHGLVIQPNLAPLCFAWRARNDEAMLETPSIRRKAARLATLVDGLAGKDGMAPVFIGRIGTPTHIGVMARSVRLPLEKLTRR